MMQKQVPHWGPSIHVHMQAELTYKSPIQCLQDGGAAQPIPILSGPFPRPSSGCLE